MHKVIHRVNLNGAGSEYKIRLQIWSVNTITLVGHLDPNCEWPFWKFAWKMARGQIIGCYFVVCGYPLATLPNYSLSGVPNIWRCYRTMATMGLHVR